MLAATNIPDPDVLKFCLQLGARDEDQAHCENFALAVFNRADRVDRAGRADKATAVTFYAASYFFEVSRSLPPPSTVNWVAAYVHSTHA